MRYADEMGKYIVVADSLLKNLLYMVSPLYHEEFGIEQQVTIPLFTSLHSTSESILILLLNQAVFDADILLRSIMEGTIKYCYLMTGTNDERNKKYIEYKVSLSEIDALADHFKAINTIEALKKHSHNSLKPFECFILDEHELERLQKAYPKTKRNEIKRRWTYQSLLRELAEKQPEYEAQIGTLSTYSLESHFGHYDWTGVSSRQAQMYAAGHGEDETYDVIHALRIISNILSMALFRVMEYLRCYNYHITGLTELSLQILDFIHDIDNIQNSLLEIMA